MSHLRPEELLDLVENLDFRDSIDREVLTGHIASCPECRGQLEDARQMMAAASDDALAEPEPLFWDRFSAQVRHAVAAEASSARRPGWGRRFGLNVWSGGAVAAAAAVAIVAVSLRPGPSSERVEPVPAAFERGSGGGETPLAGVDEASLGLLGGLASDLSWDAASEAGLAADSGAVDAMLRDLAPEERQELQRVLLEELSRSDKVKS
jgi:hypothetical protein